MTTQTYVGSLFIQTCCECGILFGIEQTHENMLRSSGKKFFCTNGHSQYYPGETDEAKAARLARELSAAKDREDTLREQNHKHWRLQRAAEGKVRALKKRVAAGVCPCCTRTFQNLARHMRTQHPGVATE